jgi:hypothetical protein
MNKKIANSTKLEELNTSYESLASLVETGILTSNDRDKRFLAKVAE